MQQTIYCSKDTHSYVRIIDHCTSFKDSQPVDSYIYVEADKASSVYTHKYVMPIVDFHSTHSAVLDELTLENLGDGVSILDRIRQGQLFDIFGKYKLF